MLLHFPSNFQLAIQPLTLCHLPTDGSRQPGDLQRQSGLRRRPRVETLESARDRATCELVRFNFLPRNEVCGESLLVSMVPQRVSDKLPQAAICRRGEPAKEVVERRAARIQKLQKYPACLSWVFHNEVPQLLA